MYWIIIFIVSLISAIGTAAFSWKLYKEADRAATLWSIAMAVISLVWWISAVTSLYHYLNA